MFQFIEGVEKSTMPHLAESVVHHTDPTVNRPAIFNLLVQQGRSLSMKKFMNQLLIYVALSLKSSDGVPHAPSTVATSMRALFSCLKKEECPWVFDDFKGWEGAMQDVVDKAWEVYLSRDGDFGKKTRKEFTADDHAKMCLFIKKLTKEQRMEWIQNIVQFCLGTQFGLRGNKEHRDLRLKEIVFGVYPLNAGAGLAGKPYVEITGTLVSKTNKVTMCTYHLSFSEAMVSSVIAAYFWMCFLHYFSFICLL